MIYTIKEGKHYPTPTQAQKLFIAPKLITLNYKVSFCYNCRYTLPSNDMYDINKLFGVSFGHHHQNSERFGWRYSPDYHLIELFKYSYIDGVRCVDFIRYLHFNQIYNLTLKITVRTNEVNVHYQINDSYFNYQRPKPKKLFSRLSYTLGLYFGGNRTAPHNMNINLIKF